MTPQAPRIEDLIARWRIRAETMRRNAKDSTVESLIAQRADAFKECAEQLSAALALAEARQQDLQEQMQALARRDKRDSSLDQPPQPAEGDK